MSSWYFFFIQVSCFLVIITSSKQPNWGSMKMTRNAQYFKHSLSEKLICKKKECSYLVSNQRFVQVLYWIPTTVTTTLIVNDFMLLVFIMLLSYLAFTCDGKASFSANITSVYKEKIWSSNPYNRLHSVFNSTPWKTFLKDFAHFLITKKKSITNVSVQLFRGLNNVISTRGWLKF